MTSKNLLFVILFCTFIISRAVGQTQDDRFRILFYNVENLFDIENDPETNDDDFTPNGSYSWSKYKLDKKISNIFKVIAAVGKGNAPNMIAVCEIENYSVLEMIINYTPLKHYDYEIIHKDSKDRRGIDVGLLYRKESYWPLKNRFVTPQFSNDPNKMSRDILYSKGILPNSDTLHIFINHWPSKYGGSMATRSMRDDVAKTLRVITDSILSSNPQANIIITGDLNTGPDDDPVKSTLGAAIFPDTTQASLINLTTAVYPSKFQGTIKFQGVWECIDQWIVSKQLLNRQKGNTKTSAENVYIGNFDFILESDKNNVGKMPFRTFVGMTYNEGYSDHLPIYIDLILVNP